MKYLKLPKKESTERQFYTVADWNFYFAQEFMRKRKTAEPITIVSQEDKPDTATAPKI